MYLDERYHVLYLLIMRVKEGNVLFSSPSQAKKFFIDKIILQAQKDHVNLTEAEKYMLKWSETEDGFESNQDLIDQFEKETTDKKFEEKIAKLIKHAYNDALYDKELKAQFLTAYNVLEEEDHYLLVMIEKALKDKTGSWLKDKLLLVLIGLVITIGGFFYMLLMGKWFSDEWIDFFTACLVYLGAFYSWSYVTYIKIERKKISKIKMFGFQFIIAGFLLGTEFLLFKYKVLRMPEHHKIHLYFLIPILLIISIVPLEYLINKRDFFNQGQVKKR